MELIPGICTQCGATVSVNNDDEAMVCPYCNTPFVVERAVQNFNTTYNIINKITANNVYIQDGKDRCFDIVGGVLKKYIGSEIDVSIPDSVYQIGEEAFSDTMIKTVKMSDNVIEIKDRAFRNCANLNEIVFSSNLKSIGERAFSGCPQIKSISLPASLEVIKECAFLNNKLNTISVHKKLILSKGYVQRCWANTYKDSFDYNIYTPSPILSDIYVDGRKLDDDDILLDYFIYTQIGHDYVTIKEQEKRRVENLRYKGCCQYCGGEFKGFFNPVCSICERKKDY